MSYLERQLNKGEKIVIKTRKSNWIFLREVLMLIITAAVYFGVSTLISAKFADKPKLQSVPMWCAVAFGALTVLMFIGHIVSATRTEIVLTNAKVASRQGVESVDIALKSIDSVTVNYGLFGSVFGYGNLYINTAGGKTYAFKKISKPAKFVQKLNKQVAKASKQMVVVNNNIEGVDPNFAAQQAEQQGYVSAPFMQPAAAQPQKSKNIAITFGVSRQQQELADRLLGKKVKELSDKVPEIPAIKAE